MSFIQGVKQVVIDMFKNLCRLFHLKRRGLSVKVVCCGGVLVYSKYVQWTSVNRDSDVSPAGVGNCTHPTVVRSGVLAGGGK